MSTRITVNGAPVTLEGSASLHTLIDHQGWLEQTVAVAVEDRVVPRSQWHDTTLTDGQKVTTLSPMQGG